MFFIMKNKALKGEFTKWKKSSLEVWGKNVLGVWTVASKKKLI